MNGSAGDRTNALSDAPPGFRNREHVRFEQTVHDLLSVLVSVAFSLRTPGFRESACSAGRGIRGEIFGELVVQAGMLFSLMARSFDFENRCFGPQVPSTEIRRESHLHVSIFIELGAGQTLGQTGKSLGARPCRAGNFPLLAPVMALSSRNPS